MLFRSKGIDGQDIEIKTNYINVTSPAPPAPSPPTANFNGTPLTGTAPLNVIFVDLSDAASPINWTWDFTNDGIVDSTSQNASHTYISAGLYTVRHGVTNSSGSDDETKIDYINVTSAPGPSPPIADFNGVPTDGSAPLSVSFTDTSDAFGATGWTWDYTNDGIIDAYTKDGSHIYAAPGIYSVAHSVTNASGSNTKTKNNYITVATFSVDFTANVTSSTSVPLYVQFIATPDSTYFIDYWYWEFGDGNLDNVQNPINMYTNFGVYTVRLRIQNVTNSLEYWMNKSAYIDITDIFNQTLRMSGDMGDTWIKWEWLSNTSSLGGLARPVDLYLDGIPQIMNYTRPYFYAEDLQPNEEHRLELWDNETQILLGRSTLRTMAHSGTILLLLIICAAMCGIVLITRDDLTVIVIGLLGLVFAVYARSISYNYYGIDWVFTAMTAFLLIFLGLAFYRIGREKLVWY